MSTLRLTTHFLAFLEVALTAAATSTRSRGGQRTLLRRLGRRLLDPGGGVDRELLGAVGEEVVVERALAVSARVWDALDRREEHRLGADEG